MINNYTNSVSNFDKSKVFEFARKGAASHRLTVAAKAGYDVYENEWNKICNSSYARQLQGKITIQEIFIDNWNDFLNIQAAKNKPIRDSIITNVNKMINCRNFKYGYLFYECPNCGDFYLRGFSCHSRFCASCGKKYRDARAKEISEKCLDVPHRHITWTISKKLRVFFAYYRDLYDELFKAVNDVLSFLIKHKSKSNKKLGKRLGFVSILHTFGRDMKLNPHIHTLIAECTLDNNGKKENYEYFNFKSLRQSFMNQLLKRMYHYLKNNATKDVLIQFTKIRNELYNIYDNGFYVHAPKRQGKSHKAIKSTVNYVVRYAGHPAMSEARITSYDKDNKTVSYYYDPHEDDAILDDEDKKGRQYITESVYNFIAKLIIHIPETSVHTTRYYGFYANKCKIEIIKKDKLYNTFEINKMKNDLEWRSKIISTYSYDPLMCKCGTIMTIVYDLCYFGKEDG
ncbi:MAG: transposase [Bacilli bacterium]|nr:transposase [Bacilli bacterium]